MGDIQQIEFMKTLAPLMRGPILEIGSKRYGPPPRFFNYRTLFPEETKYVGIDIEDGQGVDHVIDMTSEIGTIKQLLGGEQFNSIICFSVMEHVRDIYTFSKNVVSLLSHDGLLAISVPFVWELHAYPYDFWRFTPGAIEFLYPTVDFDSRLSQLHTDTGKCVSLEDSKRDFNKYIKLWNLPREKKTLKELIRRRTARMGITVKRKILGLKKDMVPLHSMAIEMVGFKKRS